MTEKSRLTKFLHYKAYNEPLPPVYRLIAVMTTKSHNQPISPVFPLAIIPTHGSDVDFKFWGSDNYDVHEAFKFETANSSVTQITYSILYDGQNVAFRHRFSSNVILSLNGLHGNKVIMKPFRRLDDMPDLQSDWHYFQFVG